jgi:hypothetical protein
MLVDNIFYKKILIFLERPCIFFKEIIFLDGNIYQSPWWRTHYGKVWILPYFDFSMNSLASSILPCFFFDFPTHTMHTFLAQLA